MSDSSTRLVRMTPRDPHEPGRTASTLELFFDLVFVVAVSTASAELHHALAEGHVRDGLIRYAVVFFGIWWAWMNFTWFATSFDADDWLYRVLTVVQMGGVLTLAAGIEPTFQQNDYRILVFGYVIMRLAMVAQWLRASLAGGHTRRTTLTYAAGIALVQCLWLAWLLLSGTPAQVCLGVLIAAELAIPVIAEARGRTPSHPHHITERYGLFTLIVLGESLLASANAIFAARSEQQAYGPLISLAALVLTITATLWWIYFWPEHHHCIGGMRRSLRYGYVHYIVFASAAAVSVGIEIQIDALTGHSPLGTVGDGYSVAIPVAVFLLSLWWIAIREQADRMVRVVVPLAAALILVDPLLSTPILSTAVILVLVVVALVWRPPVTASTATGGHASPRRGGG
ncbi:low temperature requirement protein A [Mobilicoccus sp.]|uniref:low temperature requirement protein A n=3 Tax=Mobilicoccus sp. TaxID=2034349 RepID=UPI0028992601|nr:low temperature requirement protein A [Mobilicoccus sp.]